MDQVLPFVAAKSAGAGHKARTKRRGRAWLVVAGATAAVAGLGVWWVYGRPASPHYSTTAAQVGSVTHSVIASGTVNPQLTVLVGAYVSGTIQDIYCDFNTKVRRGQICARIDPRPYQTVVDGDAAALATARAQRVKDQAALRYAQLNDQRTAVLAAQGWISKDTADQVHSTLDQAAAQVGLDETTINQRAAALSAARINLGYADITSPVDGTVVSRNVTQGQTVAASFQTPTLFLIATDLTRMQVDANVSESDIGGGLRVGDPASFTVDAFPQRTFKASVTQIRQAPQTVQNVITYDVVLTVDNADLALKPGMTATARIIVAQRRNVLRVPNQALRYRPGGLGTAPNGQAPSGHAPAPRVWVLRAGKPVRTTVQTGLADEAFTEIVGGGLKDGDPVITAESGAKAGAPAARTPALRL